MALQELTGSDIGVVRHIVRQLERRHTICDINIKHVVVRLALKQCLLRRRCAFCYYARRDPLLRMRAPMVPRRLRALAHHKHVTFRGTGRRIMLLAHTHALDFRRAQGLRRNICGKRFLFWKKRCSSCIASEDGHSAIARATGHIPVRQCAYTPHRQGRYGHELREGIMRPHPHAPILAAAHETVSEWCEGIHKGRKRCERLVRRTAVDRVQTELAVVAGTHKGGVGHACDIADCLRCAFKHVQRLFRR